VAKAPYAHAGTRKRVLATPQTMAIPGRELEMTENLAGAKGFKVDPWQALRRWLLTGSMSNCFYQGKEEMTKSNVSTLNKLIKEDPIKVGQEIIDVSKKGVSVHTPIFALTLLSTGEGPAKNAFREIFPMVIRNGSQLYEFFNYTRDNRGFGSLIHKTVNAWLAGKDAKELEYQFLKYQSRYDWSAKDVLRMVKPQPENDLKKAVYNWAVGGTKRNPLLEVFPAELERINAYEKLKKGAEESDIIDAIAKFRMTWEMMPGNLTMTNKIWEALFKQMPVGATIRNLGNLTEKEVFKNKANIEMLEERFSKENLAKAYIHPVVFAAAMKAYLAGGEGGKSKLRWKPIARVTDAMEDGIEKCFDVLEPTGKDFFYALDISDSMTMNGVGKLNMTPIEVEGVMALASVRSEKNYFVGGFNTSFTPLNNFSRKMTYKEAMSFYDGDFGSTDADQAYKYAIKNNVKTDVFVFFTDSESWSGMRHPAQGFAAYKSRINSKAKAIYVTLVPFGDQISLADPKDPNSYDIAGFTGETPKLINLIAKGEI
jgi:60 kDa SS-A/Ro ribonucleoprotein